MQHLATAHSYYQCAADFMAAADVLIVNRPPRAATTIGLLTAHALETGLKAYLLHTGRDEEYIKNEFGHNLKKLWSEASKVGLPVASEPPSWCKLLNDGHNSPYPFRYYRTNTGLVTPKESDIFDQLRQVIAVVKQAINT